MKEPLLTKSNLPVELDGEWQHATGCSGWVLLGEQRVREHWNHLGHANIYPHHDLSWSPPRVKTITYDDLVGYNFIRSAQNHRCVIIYADGYGVTVVRAMQMQRLEYSSLGSYEKSKDGLKWIPCGKQES